MKPERATRMFLSAFLIALAGYFVLYTAIEKRRTKSGPWQVGFGSDATGAPVLAVNHPALGITNVQIVFTGRSRPHAKETVVNFSTPRPVPFDLPFGRCVFMDTTFLPGTITLQAFGHELEFLPRVLVVDHERRAWHSGEVIALASHSTPPPAAQ